jgi:hypothetical protein
MTDLPARMREAANTIEEFNTRLSDLYNRDGYWRPSELRREAAHLEDEDREAAEREEMVAELAEFLKREVLALPAEALWDRTLALRLINLGWRKDTP